MVPLFRHFGHLDYTITARLWYNCPTRTEFARGERMCEDILMYNKRFAFIIPHFVQNLLQHFFDFSGVCARVIATFLTGFLHLLLHLT